MSETSDPNYAIIELQAQNELLKDKVIALLEEEITRLKLVLNEKNKELGIDSQFELPVEGLVVARPRLRTMTEVGRELEKRSLNAISLKEVPKNA